MALRAVKSNESLASFATTAPRAALVRRSLGGGGTVSKRANASAEMHPIATCRVPFASATFNGVQHGPAGRQT